MIKHTFCHIPGIGEKIEQRLWAQVLISWDQDPAQAGELVANRYEALLRKQLPPSQLEITTIALYDGEHVYTYVSGHNLEDYSI